jgi:heme/copper-type cytochrome/quinol oxidase subunit 4
MNVPNVNYSDPEQAWWNMVAIICGVIGLAPLVPVSLWMLRYTD